MIIQAQILCTSVITAIASGLLMELFRDTEIPFFISAGVFIASLVGILWSIIWLIWS